MLSIVRFKVIGLWYLSHPGGYSTLMSYGDATGTYLNLGQPPLQILDYKGILGGTLTLD